MIKRLTREYTELLSDPPDNFNIGPTDSDLTKWEGVIFGPLGSPYEGGVFRILVTISQDYPFQPPSVKFFTQMYL